MACPCFSLYVAKLFSARGMGKIKKEGKKERKEERKKEGKKERKKERGKERKEEGKKKERKKERKKAIKLNTIALNLLIVRLKAIVW